MMGTVVETERGCALVTGVLADALQLEPLLDRPASGPLEVVVPATNRVIDVLGGPLDHGGPIDGERVPIFVRDPYKFVAGHRRWNLGPLIHDLRRRPLGQSIVAIGSRELLQHVLAHQAASGRAVIVASHRSDGGHTRVMFGDTIASRWLAPHAAMAIAHALRARGRDVVVAIESIDHWRSAVKAMPHRGGWATQVAQLASRAYALPSGSVSLIASTAEVTPALAAGFDTSIELGELRGYTKYVEPPIKMEDRGALGGVMLALARFHEIMRVAPWAELAELDRSTTQALDHGRKLHACLRYRRGATIDSLEQMLALLAVVRISDLPASNVIDFVDAYHEVLRREHAPRLDAIRKANLLSKADDKALFSVATKLSLLYVAS